MRSSILNSGKMIKNLQKVLTVSKHTTGSLFLLFPLFLFFFFFFVSSINTLLLTILTYMINMLRIAYAMVV